MPTELIYLTEEEQARPLEIVRDFFQSCKMSEIRQTLWQMLEASIPSQSLDKTEDRSHFLWFYREVQIMIEGSYLLCQKGVLKVEKKPLPSRAYKGPYPKWKTKADLEDEIKNLQIKNAEYKIKILSLQQA